MAAELVDVERRLERLERQEWSDIKMHVLRIDERLEEMERRQRLLLFFAVAGAVAIPVVAWGPWLFLLAVAIVS